MFIPVFKRGKGAFSTGDLAITVGVIFLLASIGITLLYRKRQQQAATVCMDNLKRAVLAVNMSYYGQDNLPPWRSQFYPNSSSAFTNSGKVLPHFLALSNEIQNPIILTCPADNRSATTNWSTLTDKNISYFINFNSDDNYPDRVAFGDRRFTSTIPPNPNNIVILATNSSYAWSSWIHGGLGTLGLSGGSVCQLRTKDLTSEFHSRENLGSRLQLPR